MLFHSYNQLKRTNLDYWLYKMDSMSFLKSEAPQV